MYKLVLCIVLALVSIPMIQGYIEMPEHSDGVGRAIHLEEWVFIKETIMDLTTQNQELNTLVRNQKQEMTEAKKLISHLFDEIGDLKHRLDDQEKIVDEHLTFSKINAQELNTSIQEVETLLANHIATPTKRDNQSNEVGCLSDTLVLLCNAGGTINVTSALYGEYYAPCSDCCVPNPPYDCTEDIVDKNLEEFIKIKLRCDNESTCAYVYEGVVISDCQEGYVADYMQINYDCIGDSDDFPIAFTAYTTVSTAYDTGEVIVFETVLSNFGGFYNEEVSEFTCPFDAIYLFTADLQNYAPSVTRVEIAIDGTQLIGIWADNGAADYNQATGFCITQCLGGQVVNVKALTPSYVYGGYHTNHFSGYMLNRL